MQPRFQPKTLLATALTALAIMGAAATAGAWEREPLSVYHERRARLIRDTGGDGVVVLYGYREADVAASVTPFRQNEEFYYLTGWNEPDAIMLLAPKAHSSGAEAELGKEILYIPAHNRAEEKWTGPKLAPDDSDAAALTGFRTVHDASQFARIFRQPLRMLPKSTPSSHRNRKVAKITLRRRRWERFAPWRRRRRLPTCVSPSRTCAR